MNRQQFFGVMLEAFGTWMSHDASLRAGALTFFTIMPLPSIMLIGITVFAQIYGQGQALTTFIQHVSSLTGPTIGNLLLQVLQNAHNPLTSIFGSAIGVVFAVMGAVGAFSVLQKSLNLMWDNKPKGIARRKKLVPFLLIAVVGFVVVVWTAISTIFFKAAVDTLTPFMGFLAPWVLRGLHIIVSLALGTLLFAIIFKELPEAKVEWSDVWWAAGLTSIIFTFLNYLFGVYITFAGTATLAGTAGTLMFLLFWIYLANLFILFGGEFSKVYTETLGSRKGQAKPAEKLVDRIEVKTKVEWKVSPKS